MPPAIRPRAGHFIRTLTIICLAAAVAPTGGAKAWTFKVIHNFCAAYNCDDGGNPRSTLILDSTGTLYGVAPAGGPSAQGTAFQLAPTGDKWKYGVLYEFCVEFNCADGALPNGPLVIDINGNLYGTTASGGGTGYGTVFELLRNGDRIRRSLVTLHSFVASGDGQSPAAGLTYQGAASGVPFDGSSALYGTTSGGGRNSVGTVFSLIPNGVNSDEEILYEFCSYPSCGQYPAAELIFDASSNLYGTAYYGGTDGNGVAFKLTNNSGIWQESVLRTFCRLTDCKDGTSPQAALVMDASGALLGTTFRGGRPRNGCCGIVFRLASDGSAFDKIYDFCSNHRRCRDGANPTSALLLDSSGTLFGTASAGGNYDGGDYQGAGIVFALTGSSLQVLHSFCSEASCADGWRPVGGLAMDAAGNLFGTTVLGGKFNGGVAFEISP